MKCKLNVMNKTEWSYRCLEVGWALPISCNELGVFPFFWQLLLQLLQVFLLASCSVCLPLKIQVKYETQCLAQLCLSHFCEKQLFFFQKRQKKVTAFYSIVLFLPNTQVTVEFVLELLAFDKIFNFVKYIVRGKTDK